MQYQRTVANRVRFDEMMTRQHTRGQTLEFRYDYLVARKAEKEAEMGYEDTGIQEEINYTATRLWEIDEWLERRGQTFNT